MAISFKGAHFPQDIILMGVRWYLAYPLSYRHVEELMEERGVLLDHADHPALGRQIQSPVRRSVPAPQASGVGELAHGRDVHQIKGEWSYLYRAVDKTGQTIDFLLTKQRDERAAKRFLTKAIRRNGVPEKITIDGSAANKAAIESYNAEHGTTIAIRQVKI